MSPKNVKIKEAVHLFFRNYAKFDGRSTRSEFWWGMLVLLVGNVVLRGLGFAVPFFNTIHLIFWLATLVPAIAVAIRRFHDIGKSGYYVLLLIIPAFGILIDIYFLAQPGDTIPNQYGEPADFGQPY